MKLSYLDKFLCVNAQFIRFEFPFSFNVYGYTDAYPDAFQIKIQAT